MITVEAIIFYLLLIDSVSCVLLVWFGKDWYVKHFRIFSRWFPPARGWASYYLVLVAYIGWLTWNAGLLF